MRECCIKAINNNNSNYSLTRLQRVVTVDYTLSVEQREKIEAFLEGMKIKLEDL